MTSNGTNGHAESDIEVDPAIFQDLSTLEKEFAGVELNALRKKEFNLAPLYARRAQILSKLPSFWPQVLLNGPQEFQSILSHDADDEDGNIDIATIGAIKNVRVERYQITSETEGEPRSLRFTFEFGENPIFEDTKVVKEFEYVAHPDGDSAGGLISKPVSFKWTKKGKKLVQDKTGGLLDLALDLYRAEEAAMINVKGKDGKKGSEVSMVDREGLWQYEKLREKLEKIEDKTMEGGDDTELEGCWLDWFGYRGPVDINKEKSKEAKTEGEKSKKQSRSNSDDADEDDFEGFGDEDDEDDDDDGLLEVEIFPAGEEIAIALADDLWPNVMKYFMGSQDPLADSDDEIDFDEDDEAPELVEAPNNGDGDDDTEEPDSRPLKKQRTK